MKYMNILLLWLYPICQAESQILFTESFNVILDTTKFIKGTITPDVKFQTQKANLFEFENMADLSIRIGKSGVTFANKIELTRYGGKTLLSGSYVYGEYRLSSGKVFITEIHTEIHWSEARGLERKYAGGVNARFCLIKKQNLGIFTGIGPFYEYENWNYDGVPDSDLPENPVNVIWQNIKLGSYISYKQNLFGDFNLDLSIYHQSRFDEIFSTPRLASSSKISFFFTQHLELVFIYQNIYDYKPVVPIDKWFHKYIFSIAISF